MSILFFILALFACVVSGFAGAFGMRFISERNREIAEQEDVRDTMIRDLQAKIKLAANDTAQNRRKAESATEHVALAHDRIITLLEEIKNLKSSLENQQAVQGSDSDEKELLHDKLSAATRQLDTLRQRNQELEVEISLIREPDMLAPHDAGEDAEEDEVDPFEPTVTDGSPSLIQALTGELDRWKRHCHVLGDELKNKRQQVSETSQAAPHTVMTIADIDELTDIRGIGAVLARKLHKLGIFRYEDLLNLSSDALEQAHELIPDFARRMQRDDWLEQARMLHESKYNQADKQAEAPALA